MNDKKLRVIKTARSEKAINDAVKNGYWPLVKPVIQSPEIKRKFAVFQNVTTGEIEVVHDFRSDPNDRQEVTINFTFYYPHNFESPFAAYLIPSDIKKNETLWVEDVIEDIVANGWNQGDNFRLNESEAVWNGEQLIFSHHPRNDRMVFIG